MAADWGPHILSGQTKAKGNQVHGPIPQNEPAHFAVAERTLGCHCLPFNNVKTKPMFSIIGILAFGILQSLEVRGGDPIKIFDGKTLNGWEGNTNTWRVESTSIVAGSLDRRQPHNDFLATRREFGNFELRLQYKVEGTNGFVNGGVQFWSQRVPNNFEVSGYQADLGAETDGNLYDESRRNRNLVEVKKETRKKVLRPGDWNDYRIRAEGAHIQLWLNGVKTVDYTESDRTIPQRGIIALQIHGGAYTKIQYRDLVLEELPKPDRGEAR